jgi:hypothetical protein
MKRRHETLQGKYNAETARLQEEVRALAQDLAHVRSQPPQEPAPSLLNYLTFLTDKERENMPEETLQLTGKLAHGVASVEAKAVEDRIRKDLEERLRRLEQQSQRAETQGLWDRVDAICPGAKLIDSSDPDWPEWLNGRDSVSGVVRRQLGIAAAQTGDIRRLADLIEEFRKDMGKPVSSEIASQRKPARTGADTIRGSGSGKAMISQAEIKKFYDDIAKGLYRNRPEAREQREKEIDQAWRDGRIQT